MRALVTGATGFLGSRIARLLRRSGHAVRATGLPSDPFEHLTRLGCEYAPADLLDPEAVIRLVSGCDTVFHVAGLALFTPRRYALQRRVNVEGTRHVVEACRRAGVRRLVYTSTVNTLGIPPANTVGDETTPFNWDRWGLGYMDSKWAAQQLVLGAVADGLDAVCALPCTMLGPGDRFFAAGTYIREAARGRLLLAPPGGTTFAHVDDVAEGHLLAAQRGSSGARYVLGGDHLSYATFYRVINGLVGRPGPFGVVPAWLLRAGGRAADRLRALGLDLDASEGLAVAGCSGLYYSSVRARQALGYCPRPAVDGIREAVAWYSSRGLI